MTNTFFNHDTPLTDNTAYRASNVNDVFEAVELGFDRLPAKDALNHGHHDYLVDSGAADAYVVAFASNAPTAYANGMSFKMKAANANTGASTINVNGIGVKNLTDINGSPLVEGDITTGAILHIAYDGSAFRIIGGRCSTATEFNSAILTKLRGVRHITELLALDGALMVDGEAIEVGSYFSGGNTGGGLFVWDAGLAKSNHDGITTISPTVPWDGTAGTVAAFIAGTGETASGSNGCWVRDGRPFALPQGTTLTTSVLRNNGYRFFGVNSAGSIENFGAIMGRIVDDTSGSEAGEIYIVVNDVDFPVAVWKWDQNGAAISDVGAPGGIMAVGPGGERVSVVERDYEDARPIGIRNLRNIDPGDLTDTTFRVGLTATMYNAAEEELQVGATRWRYLNRGNGTEKTVKFDTLLSNDTQLDVQSLYVEGSWVVADPAVSGGNEVTETLFPDDIFGVGSGRAAVVGTSGSALLALVGDGAVADGGGPFGLVFAGRITTGSGKTGRTSFASITGVKANATEGNGSGRLEFKTTVGGGGLTRRGYAEVGLVWGAPTGGDKGAGTINAQAVYDDNTLLTDYVFDLHVDGRLLDDSDRAKSYQAERQQYTSIDEFSSFWKKHKHMPTMPSREEWEKDGTRPLGDLVQRLWETVELQALHINHLNEKLSRLIKSSVAGDK